MPNPIVSQVVTIDPWGTIPPGTSDVGVQVTVSNPGDAPDPKDVLIGRLVQGVTPLAYGLGGTASYLFIVPLAPLSAALPYAVQVQWALPNTNPQDADWTVAGVVTAPVLTTGVAIGGGTVDGTDVSLSWVPSGAAQPSTGYVQVFDERGNAVAWVTAAGEAGTGRFVPAAGVAYTAYASLAAPVTPGTDAGYAIGPSAPALPLPTAAPAIDTVAFDGRTLAVAWTPPVPPAGLPVVATITYALLLLSSGGRVLGRFAADAGGGTADVDPATVAAGMQVAGQLAYGPITGPVGTPQRVLPVAPQIGSITAATGSNGTDLTVTLVPPAGLGGAALSVAAVVDGVTGTAVAATGSPPRATVTATLGTLRNAVVASAAIARTGTTAQINGPVSAPAPVVAGPAGRPALRYDGTTLHVSWGAVADPALTGYRVGATGLPAATYAAGLDPVLAIPAALTVGTTVGVTVVPVAGAAAGLPVQSSYTVPAPGTPSITAATVSDGATLALAWSPVAADWLDGYRVAVTGTVTSGNAPGPLTVEVGRATSAVLTLPASDQPVTWSVTVAALAGATAGLASAAVVLFPAVPEVTGVSVSGTTASVAWALQPGTSAVLTALRNAGASVQAQLLDDANVVAATSVAVSTNASGTLAVTLPGTVTGRLRAAVQLVAAAQTGTRSDAVPVLTRTPAVTSGVLTADALELAWAPSGDAGATAYAVVAGTARATTSATRVVLPLAPGAPVRGPITVTPLGADTTGPAASVAVVSAYGIASATYDGATLTVTPVAAGTPTPAELLVEVRSGGATAARTAVAGDTTSAIRLPVALAPGAGAQVRVLGTGAGSLALPSAPLALPTSTPRVTAAAYDGKNINIEWAPVADPGVTGYLVTIEGASPTIPPAYVAAPRTSLSVAATFAGAFPGSAAVTVQASVAIGGDTTRRIDGPGATATTAPTLAGSVRTIAASATGAPPYAARHGAYATLADAQGAPITVALANPFPSGTPTVTDGGSPVTFKLAAIGSPLAGGPAYTLTIAQSVWTSFDGTVARAALRATYRAFLKAVDAAGAGPGGMALVREAVAAALPQTFAETLYYRYGLWLTPPTPPPNPTLGVRVVDLDAGLRLRLTGAGYQTPSGALNDARNGFVALGTEEYDLAEIYPAGTGAAGLGPALTVDAFLATLLAGAGGSTGAVVAASTADLFAAGARQPYLRLFYPQALPGSGTQGSATATNNVALLGTPNWTALENATDTYAQNGTLPVSDPSVFVAYFRGRAMLTPLAAVALGGQRVWVPVGTSVRQLLAASGAPVADPAIGTRVALTRAAAGVYETAQGGSPLRAEPVSLTGADLGRLVPQLAPVDLPLLGGDRVDLLPAEP